MEVSKKVYIKGKRPLQRLENLQKMADRYFNGNFSEMTNDCWNKCFDLDPETGELLHPNSPAPHFVLSKKLQKHK